MDRRDFLRTGLLAGAGALCAPLAGGGLSALFAASGRRPRYSARTIELVGRSTVVDMLSLLTLDWDRLYGWQRQPESFGQDDFLRFRGSGIHVFHPAVEPRQADPHGAALGWTAAWNRLLDRRPDVFLRVSSAADLSLARAECKLGILIGFQSSDHFRTAGDVALFHARGQRVSQLTYNESNRLGTGCRELADRGLTPYGAEVVAAMDRAGMAVDVSHCSERTSLDAIALSQQPVLVTHSNCRALAPHPRCKSDAVIRALAVGGGVMGISAIPAFVRTGGKATIEHLLDHFDHVARLVGVEHVGLGTDTDLDAVDPVTRQVRSRYVMPGLHHALRVFDIAEGLLRRRWSERAVELALGGNFLRVLSGVWGGPAPAPARS